MTESLELAIEDAWCRVAGFYHPSTKVTLYLTPRGCITGWRTTHLATAGMVEIGTYTKAVLLKDLREDVFAAFAEMKGERR